MYTGSAFDEDVGKSSDLNSWGRQVHISVTIPLTDNGKYIQTCPSACIECAWGCVMQGVSGETSLTFI